MHFFDILVLIFFVFLLIIIGLYKSRKDMLESTYLVANRSTNLFALSATLVMTEFNSATLIAFSSLGYLIGKKALFFPFIFLIGLLFYAVVVAEKWKNYDGLSVAGFFTKRYGPSIGKIASSFLLLSMIGFTASYVKSLAILFHPIFPFFNLWSLSGILVLLVLLMCLREGLVSIIRTDVFSFLLILVIFPLILYFTWKGDPSLVVSLEKPAFSYRFLFSLIILTCFTYILAPWYGQKIFAAKTKKVAYLSVVIASVFVFFLYFIATLTTIILKQKMVVSNNESSFTFAINTFMPIGLKGLCYAILFSTSATTLTGVYSAMSSMVIADFLKEKKSAFQSKILTIIFALISFIFANILIDKVFDKIILANIPIAALSFALLAGFYWDKASKIGAYISIVIGFLVGVGSYLFFSNQEYTWYWTVYGLPLIFISGITGSLLFPDKQRVFLKSNI